MSLLLHDATVVTVDAERRVFAPGAVHVEGPRIVDVGPSDAVRRRHPTADRVVDGRQNLVYHADARDVEMVLVDGKVVVDDRQLQTVDAAPLVDRAQAAAEAAWSRFAARHGGYMAG